MGKKRITFITGYRGRGGTERVISILANYYIVSGWNVDIAMTLHSLVEYEIDSRVDVVDLSEKCGIKKGFVKTLMNIRNYALEKKPDIIVCFMAQNCLLAGLALKGINVPIIMSERIDPSMVKRNWAYEKIIEKVYSTK